MTQKRSAALSVDAASLIEDVAITPGRPEVEARVRALTERAAREPRSWMLRLALAQAYAQNGDFAA
ncbi:MAG: hypothetical protein HY320_03440, partial [Armatimonadetes bacterium]|nr:hypothetical protein [Armatimonadota bacterium]